MLGWIMCSMGCTGLKLLLKNDACFFGGMNICKATSNGRFQFAAFVHKIL